MPPITAPPIPPPIQAVINGRPKGNVTAYISGSPIPKIPTGKDPLMMFVSCLFLRHFTQIAKAAPTCPPPAIAKIGKRSVIPCEAIISM